MIILDVKNNINIVINRSGAISSIAPCNIINSSSTDFSNRI